MNIKLDKNYNISSDDKQYILTKTTINKKIKKNMTVNIGYYSSLASLLWAYIEKQGRTAEGVSTIQDLIDYQNTLITNINKAIKPLSIKVISILKEKEK